MDFDTKADIVAECWMIARDEEAWKPLFKYGDLGFPLAYAHNHKFVELQEKGTAFVEEVYAVMIDTLGVPDEEYEDFEAVLDKHIELYQNDEEDSDKEDSED